MRPAPESVVWVWALYGLGGDEFARARKRSALGTGFFFG